MIRNSIDWCIRVGAVATAVILLFGTLGCSSDNENDEPVGGGGDEAGTSGSSDSPYRNPPEECPIADPPLDDPFCFNPECPLADLVTVSDDNQPMGDCCNTVDVKLREDGMEEGERYDLEYAFLAMLPQTNENIANPAIAELMRNSQLAGADVTLLRFKDVPRTADMDGPETVKLEIYSGKLNCDGTFSFYGSNAAPSPEHEGPPDDPGRWVKKTLDVQYNGFEAGTDLVTMPAPDVVASTTKLSWVPRWKPEGIDYEQPVKFMSTNLVVGDNWSCYSSIDKAGKWVMTAKLTVFIPVEQMRQTTVPDLADQTLCGLFAYRPFNASCDDGPQDEWTIMPDSYCDADHFCWIGDPTYPEYADFWSDWYDGEDGCGGAHPCCDPAGLDSTLEPCNAYYTRMSGVVAAVDITDDVIDDPSEAISHRDNCE